MINNSDSEKINIDKNTKDCAAVRVPPPLYFIFCLGIAFLLEYLFPVTSGRPALIIRVIIGGILIIASGCFAGSAFLVLIRNKTPFEPAKPTTMIVKDGPFRFSRNPMYLSLLILISGIAFLFCSIWQFIMIPVLFLLLHFCAVKPEESYLSLKFGEEYLAYKTRVRRWI